MNKFQKCTECNKEKFPYCKTCEETACLECSPGYYLNESMLCTQCSQYSNVTCALVRIKYSSAAPVLQITGCLDKTQALIYGSCVSCYQNCKECENQNDKPVCVSCSSGY